MKKKEIDCAPEDVCLKSFFLGPQSENRDWFMELISGIFSRWFDWRRGLFPGDGSAISEGDQEASYFLAQRQKFHDFLGSLLSQFEEEVPKFSPRYAGHMFAEISLPALLGHIGALLHNPNNISRESSRVGVFIEKSAISDLAGMIGFPASAPGHFTSGGTIANFEALSRARDRCYTWLAFEAFSVAKTGSTKSIFAASLLGWDQFAARRDFADRGGTFATPDIAPYNLIEGNPFEVAGRLSNVFGRQFRGPVVLAPCSRHYSWEKAVDLLGLGNEALWPVALDDNGRLDINDLRKKIDRAESEDRPVLMVVSIAGSTEFGQFDAIGEIQDLLDDLARTRNIFIWHHVDAAYGGYFKTIDPFDPLICETQIGDALLAMGRVDSVTLDPHKLGFVPYSCGVILVRNEMDYYGRTQAAPYVQFTSSDRGPYTLEGSRPATGAAATWMTSQVIGLNANGYGRILSRTIQIRKKLERRLLDSKIPIRIAPGCESNVLCFTIACDGEALSKANSRIDRLHKALSPEARGPFVVAKTVIFASKYHNYFLNFARQWTEDIESDNLELIRMCLINPFFDSKEMDFNFTDEFMKFVSDWWAVEKLNLAPMPWGNPRT